MAAIFSRPQCVKPPVRKDMYVPCLLRCIFGVVSCKYSKCLLVHSVERVYKMVSIFYCVIYHPCYMYDSRCSTARGKEKHLSFGFDVTYIRVLTVYNECELVPQKKCATSWVKIYISGCVISTTVTQNVHVSGCLAQYGLCFEYKR